jgi:hypothetical protein
MIKNKTFSLKINGLTYSVPVPPGGLIKTDGEICLNSFAMQECELLIALRVLQNNYHNDEELEFARKACGLNHDEYVKHYNKTSLRREIIEQLTAIEFTRKVSIK